MSDHVSQLAALIESEMRWQETIDASSHQLAELDADSDLLRGFIEKTISDAAAGLKAASRKRAAFEESISRLGHSAG